MMFRVLFYIGWNWKMIRKLMLIRISSLLAFDSDRSFHWRFSLLKPFHYSFQLRSNPLDESYSFFLVVWGKGRRIKGKEENVYTQDQTWKCKVHISCKQKIILPVFICFIWNEFPCLDSAFTQWTMERKKFLYSGDTNL